MAVRRTKLARARKAAGYTQDSLAEAMNVDRSTIVRWETGSNEPQAYQRPKLARVLGVSTENLESLLSNGTPTHFEQETAQLSTEDQKASLHLYAGHQTETCDSVDDTYIALVREKMAQLLAIDAQCGGDEASKQAVRLFRSMHRRIGSSACPKHLQRDLYATAGELAEIAGWLLYDANQQDAVRQMNQEALYYLRWAGDRSIELLTLQNMAMQAEYLGHPSEALSIADSVLETDRLSPRLESLFLARSAHALAQQKRNQDAKHALGKARALYLDGTSSNDPAWSYWVDDRQFAWFSAMVHSQLGEYDKTAEIFAEALATSPSNRVRGLFSRTVYLFASLVRAGDHQQAESLVPKLAPYVLEVGSGRTIAILADALRLAESNRNAHGLRDGADYLRSLLARR